MNNDLRGHPCPNDETLAAFADGRLTGQARADVIAHLDTCEECMTTVAVALPIDRSTSGVVRMTPRRVTVALAAAALVAAVGLGGWVALKYWRRPAMERLVAFAPRTVRLVEPRVTGGFAWAAYRGRVRSSAQGMDPERMKLAGAAAEVVERARRDESASAQHEAGVATLLLDDPQQAIRHLETAARESNSAKIWSDLAAARYAAAADLEQPSLYPLALAAADRALRLDPDLAEALFNRALIVERMRLAAEARRAWLRYLEVDSSSPWADEARVHLAGLPVSSSDRFESERPRLEAAAARDDVAAVRAIVSANRERARAFGEAEYLGLWGEALVRGEQKEAARLLTVARAIGAAVAQDSGESLLRETVACIDRSTERRALAEAHALYRAGRIAHSRFDFIAARRDLRSATKQLQSSGSPMALIAAYYAASALLASNDVRGARSELETLHRAAGALPQFVNLGAQIRWELARVYRLEDDMPRAIDTFAEGASMFRRIGEHRNAAYMEMMLGGALSAAGRGDEAWAARMRAFDALSRDGDAKALLTSIGAARRAEVVEGRLEAALALSHIERPLASEGASGVNVVDALVHRALLEAATGDDVAAMQSATEAQQAAARTGDRALRERETAIAAVAAGAARLRREPRQAIALLTQSIDFNRAHQLPAEMAEPLLLRARARLAIGDAAGAAGDLEEGMRIVERRQDAGAILGSGTLHAEHALFEDAIRLALDRGDAAAAFAIAERSRGAELTVPELQRRLAGTDVVVLTLATLPEGVVAFAVGSRDFIAGRGERAREAVAVLAEESLTEDGMRAAAALYDELVRPVEPLLAAAAHVIVVPDRTLQTVPFAALYDAARKQHLVERCPVAVAASAASLVRRPSRRLETLAAVALASGSARGLPFAQSELQQLAAVYPRMAATRRTFQAVRTADADVIHLAGHTERQAGGGEEALLFEDGERVRAKTIAASPLAHAEVVALAACDTFRAPASPQTRAPSLGAAFAAAGAFDVAGTLTTIPDRDAHALFLAFHRQLSAGASAAEALRAVQIAAIRGAGPRAWRTVAILTRRIPVRSMEAVAWER